MHYRTNSTLTLSSWLACGLLCALTGLSRGQELIDEIEYARQSPPKQLGSKSTEIILQQIQWQRLQASSIRDRLAKSRDEIRDELNAISKKVDDLQAALPTEFQFSTAQTRAELATYVVQLLLNTKLELAVIVERIAQLEQVQPEIDEAVRRQQERTLNIARVELEAMMEKLEASSAMHQRGAIPRSELVDRQVAVKIAQEKLASAEAAFELAIEEPKREKKGMIVELRREMKPLQAKLEFATKLLATMQEAGGTIRKIEQLQRERDLIQRDLEWVAGELGPISRELLELENLESLIAEHKADQATEEKK